MPVLKEFLVILCDFTLILVAEFVVIIGNGTPKYFNNKTLVLNLDPCYRFKSLFFCDLWVVGCGAGRGGVVISTGAVQLI